MHSRCVSGRVSGCAFPFISISLVYFFSLFFKENRNHSSCHFSQWNARPSSLLNSIALWSRSLFDVVRASVASFALHVSPCFYNIYCSFFFLFFFLLFISLTFLTFITRLYSFSLSRSFYFSRTIFSVRIYSFVRAKSIVFFIVFAPRLMLPRRVSAHSELSW